MERYKEQNIDSDTDKQIDKRWIDGRINRKEDSYIEVDIDGYATSDGINGFQ